MGHSSARSSWSRMRSSGSAVFTIFSVFTPTGTHQSHTRPADVRRADVAVGFCRVLALVRMDTRQVARPWRSAVSARAGGLSQGKVCADVGPLAADGWTTRDNPDRGVGTSTMRRWSYDQYRSVRWRRRVPWFACLVLGG